MEEKNANDQVQQMQTSFLWTMIPLYVLLFCFVVVLWIVFFKFHEANIKQLSEIDYKIVPSWVQCQIIGLCLITVVFVFAFKYLVGATSKMLESKHELDLLNLKFKQEQKWQDIAKIKQERDDLKKKNEVLIAESKVAPVDQDILQREQQIIAMYLLTLYNSKKTSSDKNITSDDIKKILDESLESCKVIKNKITEIKDKGL